MYIGLYNFLRFFIKLYYFILIKLNIYKIAPKIESIIDVTNKYIDKKRTLFLELWNNNSKYIELNDNIEPIFYSKQEYQKILLDTNNDIERKWKTRILLESTPRGNVVMFYDIYKQGFSYYSDINSIPYKLLNSIAMKYVSTYRCFDFFVDNEITKDKESPLINIYFTDYKTQKKNTNKNLSINKINPFIKHKKILNVRNNTVTGPDYNINRFIHLGKMTNFKFIQTVPKNSEKKVNFVSEYLDDLNGENKLQKSVMSYKDYKNL